MRYAYNRNAYMGASRDAFVEGERAVAEERIAEADERSFSAEFAEAIQPILSWAEEHAPYHRAAVARPGGMRFDAPTARALLELIRLYQARQACGPEMQ